MPQWQPRKKDVRAVGRDSSDSGALHSIGAPFMHMSAFPHVDDHSVLKNYNYKQTIGGKMQPCANMHMHQLGIRAGASTLFAYMPPLATMV